MSFIFSWDPGPHMRAYTVYTFSLSNASFSSKPTLVFYTYQVLLISDSEETFKKSTDFKPGIQKDMLSCLRGITYVRETKWLLKWWKSEHKATSTHEGLWGGEEELFWRYTHSTLWHQIHLMLTLSCSVFFIKTVCRLFGKIATDGAVMIIQWSWEWLPALTIWGE